MKLRTFATVAVCCASSAMTAGLSMFERVFVLLRNAVAIGIGLTLVIIPVLARPALAQGASAAAPSSPLPPAPPRASDECGEYYPADMVSAHQGGDVFVSVHISADGTLSEANVAQSSGFPSLDAAAVKCVNGAVWVPALRDGVPVEVDWQIRVGWSPLRPSYIFSPRIGTGDCSRFYPDAARLRSEQGQIILSYRIATDGGVKNVVVTQSSGHDDLDAAAVACVSHWRYQIASQNGKPVELDRRSGVSFSFHD